jgi:glycosyltransferase involved in cell wall biosynthesis
MPTNKKWPFNHHDIKIAHIIRGKDRGGISSIVFPLIKHLESRGLQVLLIILGKGSLIEDAVKRGINVRSFEKRIKGFDPSVLKRMINILKEENVVLIHTHSIGSNLYGRLAKIFLNIPVVTTVHADTLSTLKGIFRKDIIGSILYRIDISMSRYSDMIITVSNALKERLIERGINKEKISVVNNGIEKCNEEKELDTLSIKERFGITNEKVVGIVGRLSAVKNHFLFLRSAKILLKKERKVKFLIIGDGPLKRELEILAEELGIRENVIFTGWRDDVQQLYRIMDIFVLSSHMEGMPVTLLEAMFNQVPIVATKIGGIPEVIEDGVTGYLCPPDNPNALSEAIFSILSNPAKGREMGVMGRKLVSEKFTIHSMSEAVAGIYLDILNLNPASLHKI